MRPDARELKARIAAAFPLVNDHPDVAGLLGNASILPLLGPALAGPYQGQGVTAVLTPEARGPIFGVLTAIELDAGLVLARKQDGNHPGADIPVESAPTWRGHGEVFQGRSFDLNPHDRVIIVDDWVTTGSTMRAVRNITRLLGATYLGAAALVNKASPETLDELNVHTLVDFTDLV